MKIQSLAIIFVLIVLPISIVLSEYMQLQISTVNAQTTYDSKLIDATYDAVVAFQKNTVNSTSSTISDSKIRDIEASANTFLNSIANNFSLSGNSKTAMQMYIPALVYTLYDGYYIYSPYTNDLGDITVSSNSTYQDGETIYSVKPYIYYSREYKIGSNQFVITYSLDNYISIQGEINGEQINDGGYLVDINQITYNEAANTITYRGVEIQTEVLEEYIDHSTMTSGTNYKYVKVNGVKYYLDETGSETNGLVFSYVQNSKVYLSEASSENFKNSYNFNANDSAKQYYIEAYNFTQRVLNEYGLGNLKTSNATNWTEISEYQADYDIFVITNIENSTSDFNQERAAVIRYAIEKNLPTAIANFNGYSSSTNNFQMPELTEDEWYTIINNVSLISFMQGMQIGSKSYNGYAIVTNNKNQEVVSENSIYIVASDGYYYRATDENLIQNYTITLNQGIYNVDLERKSIADENGNVTNYFYHHTESASYSSIVTRNGENLLENEDIYSYLERILNSNNGYTIAQLYYTALGRERYSMYRVGNEINTYSQ